MQKADARALLRQARLKKKVQLAHQKQPRRPVQPAAAEPARPAEDAGRPGVTDKAAIVTSNNQLYCTLCDTALGANSQQAWQVHVSSQAHASRIPARPSPSSLSPHKRKAESEAEAPATSASAQPAADLKRLKPNQETTPLPDNGGNKDVREPTNRGNGDQYEKASDAANDIESKFAEFQREIAKIESESQKPPQQSDADGAADGDKEAPAGDKAEASFDQEHIAIHARQTQSLEDQQEMWEARYRRLAQLRLVINEGLEPLEVSRPPHHETPQLRTSQYAPSSPNDDSEEDDNDEEVGEEEFLQLLDWRAQNI